MRIYDNKFFPIGSIVVLQNSKEIGMIVGYLPGNYETEVYDYIGCHLETGMNQQSHMNMDYFFFNHQDIDKIIFIGYQNRDYIAFSTIIFDINKQIKSFKNKNKGVMTEDDFYRVIMQTTSKHLAKGG